MLFQSNFCRISYILLSKFCYVTACDFIFLGGFFLITLPYLLFNTTVNWIEICLFKDLKYKELLSVSTSLIFTFRREWNDPVQWHILSPCKSRKHDSCCLNVCFLWIVKKKKTIWKAWHGSNCVHMPLCM